MPAADFPLSFPRKRAPGAAGRNSCLWLPASAGLTAVD
jgi:hypothetical protein